MLRIHTDRGTEYCGAREHHEFEPYLALEDIDYSCTKAKHPQTNGICDRLHRTMKDEFYAAAFRKKVYESLEQLQLDLDTWTTDYNQNRTHTGKYCYGRTPMQTFLESLPLAKEKCSIICNWIICHPPHEIINPVSLELLKIQQLSD